MPEGQPREALGCSRGGFGTKIHDLVNPTNHPVVLKLAGAADSPRLPSLIAGLETDAVLGDKVYDSNENRAAIRARGAEPCIPPRKNRTEPVVYDRHPYQERNVIERFFGHIKQYRRVATRIDKKAANDLGIVRLAAIDIMLA